LTQAALHWHGAPCVNLPQRPAQLAGFVATSVGGVTTSAGGVATSVVEDASAPVSATAPSAGVPTLGSDEPQAAVRTDTIAMHRSEERNDEVFMIRVLLQGASSETFRSRARARGARFVERPKRHESETPPT
jgi:hypothetical protein